MADETTSGRGTGGTTLVGMYPARLDEKGRLKLPVEFQRYLGGLPEKKALRDQYGSAHGNSIPDRDLDGRTKSCSPTSGTIRRRRSVYGLRRRNWGRRRKWTGRGGCSFRRSCAGNCGIENSAGEGASRQWRDPGDERRDLPSSMRAEAAKSPESDLETLQRAGFK